MESLSGGDTYFLKIKYDEVQFSASNTKVGINIYK